MKTKRMRAFPMSALAAIIVFLTACATVQPGTTSLQEIHDAYRRDFADVVVPLPDSSTAAARTAPFAETLRRIRDYRTRFAGDTEPAAHLVVLEGMVYLQSGRFGMAQLLQDTVVAVANRLGSADGSSTRDQLFARAFPHLVTGWRISTAAAASNLQAGDGQRLIDAGDSIAVLLTGGSRARLASPEADEGAIYLATSAATFWSWASKALNQPALVARGHDLIGCFLSDTERLAAGTDDALDASVGRLRYIAAYRQLGKRVQAGASSGIRCPT
jgi:hypothetical protein